MRSLTDEELKKFSEQIAQRFISHIDGFQVDWSLPDQIQGVLLHPLLTTEEVGNVDPFSINDDEIYFYTKSGKSAAFFLLKHLRNSASHKGRIMIEQKGSKTIFHFSDGNKSYVSMQGRVEEDVWDTFIEELYKNALKHVKQRKQRKNAKRNNNPKNKN